VGLPGEGGRESVGLPATAFTLPRALAGAGYTSAIAGKWHLALPEQGLDHPLRFGFDHHRGAFGNLGTGYFRWFKLVDGSRGASDVYATTDTTDDAIGFAKNLPEPWFIVVSYNAPHGPAHLPPQELHGFGAFDPERRPLLAYRSMVEAMDTEIGRLLAATASRDPVVLFLGDNGTPNWVPEPDRRRGRGKGGLYQGGIHVPFFVSHSSLDSPGRRVSGLAGVTDIFATVVELSGTEVEPARMPRDSVSLAPMLRSAGAPPVRTWIFAEQFSPNGPRPWHRYGQAIRDERYKLIRRDGRMGRFFDLVEDPDEKHPLSNLSPGAAAASARLRRLADEFPADLEGAK
jgi:arylsulfatase A-like enzyme